MSDESVKWNAPGGMREIHKGYMLFPCEDGAALEALRTYAACTTDQEKAVKITKWINEIEADAIGPRASADMRPKFMNAAREYRKIKENIFTRARLKRIMKAVGISKLLPWQYRYIFAPDHTSLKDMPVVSARGTGKTVACFIKTLMWYKGVLPSIDLRSWGAVTHDPGWSRSYLEDAKRLMTMHAKCKKAGIKVFDVYQYPTYQARILTNKETEKEGIL